MIKSSIPQSQFDLNTNLQAIAVDVTLSIKSNNNVPSIYHPVIHFLKIL